MGDFPSESSLLKLAQESEERLRVELGDARLRIADLETELAGSTKSASVVKASSALATVGRLRVELEELRMSVRDWVCLTCSRVSPGPPRQGEESVTCPTCGSATTPWVSSAARKINALKVELESAELAALATSTVAEVTEAPKAAPEVRHRVVHARPLVKALMDTGVLPANSTRVVIDLGLDDVARLYFECIGDERLIQVLTPEHLNVVANPCVGGESGGGE